MKGRELLIPILSAAVGLFVVLLVWQPFVNIVFQVATGQDPEFDLGDNYIMTQRLIYFAIEQGDSGIYFHERIIDKRVTEFAFGGPWLIGKTKKGWLAIQKESNDVHYPVAREQVESITGLSLSSVKMEKDPWPYVILRPEALAAKAKANRLCWVLLFVVPLFLGLGPYACKRIAKSVRR